MKATIFLTVNLMVAFITGITPPGMVIISIVYAIMDIVTHNNATFFQAVVVYLMMVVAYISASMALHRFKEKHA